MSLSEREESNRKGGKLVVRDHVIILTEREESHVIILTEREES